jgi:phage gp45-like
MHYGIYRGEIASIEDPDERYRYRVRVIPIHDTTLPEDHLPFASLCAFSGKDFGDVPHFEVGDRVFVMFENGSRDHPVILGSWVAGQQDQAGTFTPDFPPDQADPYTTRRKRWERVDRDGNALVKTEGTTAVDEESLRIEAVNKLVLKTQNGDLEVLIENNGTVTIKGNLTMTVDGDADITIKGNATATFEQDADIVVQGNLTANVDGNAELNVDGDVDIVSTTGAVNVEATAGNVNVEATAGDVNVNAPAGQANVTSPDVRLGATPTEKVVTEARLATFFNAHTHPETGATTGVPVVPLLPGVVNSPQVTAS